MRRRLRVRLSPDSGHLGRTAHSTRSAKRRPEQVQHKLRLVDHLIRTRQQHVEHRAAERLGGLEIDDQLKLGRGLNGRSAGFRPWGRMRLT
jgi:hypothetical protein